jgi:type IV pilus assembly protein PilV
MVTIRALVFFKGLPIAGKRLGFSLIEVLIALIVLSVGLIGTAALTVISLQSVHSALYTSIASGIALDFEERLWLEAALEPEGCPSETNVLSATLLDWDSANTFLRLPSDFEVLIEEDEISQQGRARLIPLIISWPETRFVGLNNADERFRYTAAIHCRNTAP